MASTRVAPPRSAVPSPESPLSSPNPGRGEARILLPGIGWALYEALASSLKDRPAPRLTYVDGDLELMSPSYLHELLTARLRTFVEMVAAGLGRRCLCAGSTRWHREEMDRGKEPDACFYLANEPRVRGLTVIDLAVQPPPDLAIEVEISNPLLDALAVYAALGLPEVWRCDGKLLRFLHPQEDRTYAERETSLSFPMLRAAEALDWVLQAEADEGPGWSMRVLDWARGELAARQPPGPGGPEGRG